MEAIEQELKQKGIEKTEPVVEAKKPRKPRSQAQKDAFDRARKVRQENLAKKKLEQEKEVSIDTSLNQSQSLPPALLPPSDELETKSSTQIGVNQVEGAMSGNASKSEPKKKRGRPKGSKSKKLKREPVPELGQPNFLPPNQPPPPGDLRYQYQYPHPMMYQQPPQVHNYYYGHQQGAVNQAPPEPSKPPTQNYPTPPTPTLDNEPFLSSSEEEEAHSDYLIPPEPDLKYRFA